MSGRLYNCAKTLHHHELPAPLAVPSIPYNFEEYKLQTTNSMHAYHMHNSTVNNDAI
jgi:hypothetical protein